jgi:hypothetical protein
VVTLLTPLFPELEFELDPELEPDVVPELETVEPDPLELVAAVVVLGVDTAVVPGDVVDALLASAGSCPEMSTNVIISQAATNSATPPEITRRRILRARAIRAPRSACPRARASALLSVIWLFLVVGVKSDRSLRSASTPPVSAT